MGRKGEMGISHFSNLESGGTIEAKGELITAVQELIASGAATPGIQSLELNHATVIINATMARPTVGLFIVKDTSAAGVLAHNLVLTTGTFDGTNTTVTFNAPNDALVVYFDSAGDGSIIANIGLAVLS